MISEAFITCAVDAARAGAAVVHIHVRDPATGRGARDPALAPIVGGNVRVGLEDNPYLSRGRLATNAELVERAVGLLEGIE